jgi:cysteinyl-tRNA synthetase
LKGYCIDNIPVLNKEQQTEHESDFVLRQSSESHQPHWHSPCGLGRPGSLIQCNVMHNIILGMKLFSRRVFLVKNLLLFFSDSQCDIHTSRNHFSCHDNVTAECGDDCSDESYIKYEMEIGEPAIEPCETLKLSNDFVNMQKEHQQYSRYIRLCCLLHLPLSNAHNNQMNKAMNYYNIIVDFFRRLKIVLELT